MNMLKKKLSGNLINKIIIMKEYLYRIKISIYAQVYIQVKTPINTFSC